MVLLLGIHTTEMHCICSPNSYAKTPTAGWLIGAQIWKLSKWPLAIEWIIQLWYAASTDDHTSMRWAMRNCTERRTTSQSTCVTKRKKSHGKVWSVNPFTQTMKSAKPTWVGVYLWFLRWEGLQESRGLWRHLLCGDTWFRENSSQVGLCTLSVCSWYLSKMLRIKGRRLSRRKTGRGKMRGRRQRTGARVS